MALPVLSDQSNTRGAVKAIVMISADRMKSVLMAPAILSASRDSGVPAGSIRPSACGACGKKWCQTFSAPSEHRYAPPNIRSGVISQGAKALRPRATGSRISSLLRIEPRAMRPTMGNSREGAKLCKYLGVNAASSKSARRPLKPASVRFSRRLGR